MASPPKSLKEPNRKFADWTFEEWRNLDAYYGTHVDRWRRTLDFLRDEHWNSLKVHERESIPDWRRFPVINFSLAFYADYLSEFLQSEVRYSAVPASPDPTDISSAELSEQILKYLWDKTSMDRKRVDLAAWLMSCGVGHLRAFWDTNTGKQVPLGVPTPGGGFMPVDPETLEPDPTRGEPEMVDKGEIGVEVVSPQFVRRPRGESKGVMVGLLLNYDEAVSLYGEEEADELSYKTAHEGMSRDLLQIQEPSGSRGTQDERALVIEHYVPPSSRFPNGLWWTAADGGNQILTGPWELPAGVIPVTTFRWVPVPGDPHMGMSPLHSVTFSNKIYDELTARILEWHNKVVPKVLLKQGGGIRKGDITDEPFQELIVNSGGEPEPMQVDEAPSTFYESLNRTQQDLSIESLQGMKEEDQPKQSQAQSFRQPNEREEGGPTALAQINSKAAWADLGKTLLHYVKEFYNEQRVIGIQGPDKRFQWKEFSGKDLGNLEATIRVDETPLYPWNRKEMRDTVIGVLSSQAGQVLFADSEGNVDQERVQAALDATGIDVNIDQLDSDVMEARNEITQIENLQPGQQPPQVQDWQDSATHLDEKERILKSLRFRSWDPHKQNALRQNVKQHEKRLNQQAQQERDAMVEQERRLREVRENAELQANILESFAEKMIDVLADRMNMSRDEIAEIAGNIATEGVGGEQAGTNAPQGSQGEPTTQEE